MKSLPLKEQLSLFCENDPNYGVYKESDSLLIQLKHRLNTSVNASPYFLDIDPMLPNDVNSLFNTFGFDIQPLVVVSKDDRHALTAIQSGALDYLIKPVNQNDIFRVVGKAKNRRDFESVKKARIFFEMYAQRSFKRLIVPSITREEFVYIHEIIHCTSDANYTVLDMLDGTRMTITKPLKYFEEELPKELFFRIHQSHIINLNYVSSFDRKRSLVTMDTNISLDISRRKKSAFIHALGLI